jgi:hypothetical protein
MARLRADWTFIGPASKQTGDAEGCQEERRFHLSRSLLEIGTPFRISIWFPVASLQFDEGHVFRLTHLPIAGIGSVFPLDFSCCKISATVLSSC